LKTKFELIIEGQSIALDGDFNVPDIESCDYSCFDTNVSLDGSFKLISNEVKANIFNLFYNLPRKEKKRRFGTKSARHKIYIRIQRNLPITLNYLKRARISAKLTIGK
jgi:hypothetical protein